MTTPMLQPNKQAAMSSPQLSMLGTPSAEDAAAALSNSAAANSRPRRNLHRRTRSTSSVDPALLAHLRASKDLPKDLMAKIEAKRASTVSLPSLPMKALEASSDPLDADPCTTLDLVGMSRRRVSFDTSRNVVIVPPQPNRLMTRLSLKGRKLRLDPINNCVRLNNIAGEIRLRSPVMEVDEVDFADDFSTSTESGSAAYSTIDGSERSFDEPRPTDDDSLRSSFFSDDSGSSMTINHMSELPANGVAEEPRRDPPPGQMQDRPVANTGGGLRWDIWRLCWQG
ncbi:hypothetical protein THASP1DRAFT_27364 [Thamnocephalis sphaerospora]|uniref:Uncharacterized protein n=1 Tax=Thamnocephalis sphaerospora TaxID=78915 RepID=A0A4P9XX58_9FUNG|nr:hypothetical protein THASP1DRAFT_27364 [Thamnocephalis sphaerospora]|eukprot:RKP10877.1 hypothetical protein THASP1DRAFT_27364 [Thamnocephalis sphaerospora]